MNMADSFFDGDRSWVCDVVKGSQMLEVLKEIVKSDTRFLVDTRDDSQDGEKMDSLLMVFDSEDSELVGNNLIRPDDVIITDEFITPDDVIADDVIETNDMTSDNVEEVLDGVDTGFVAAVINEGITNDDKTEDDEKTSEDSAIMLETDTQNIRPEKPPPPVREPRPVIIDPLSHPLVGLIDRDVKDKTGPSNFQLFGARAEKSLPQGLSRSRRDSKTKTDRDETRVKREVSNSWYEPRANHQPSVKFNDLMIFEKDSGAEMSGIRGETGKSGIEKEEHEAEGVVKDAKTLTEDAISSQIIYKRMFFSFLGKMCGMNIFSGENDF
jgi:hypothetical protein